MTAKWPTPATKACCLRDSRLESDNFEVQSGTAVLAAAISFENNSVPKIELKPTHFCFVLFIRIELNKTIKNYKFNVVNKY